MKKNVIFGAIFIFCLSFTIPVYAQLGLFEQNPIDLVKKELNGVAGFSTDEERTANDPSKWVALSQKGDISIIGWKFQTTDKLKTYLVSYTFKDAKDNIEKGWWWEANTKEKIVRVILHNPELKKKYGLGEHNKVSIELSKGMSEFTVKTLYGEPDENDNDSLVSSWVYYINTQNNQRAFLKVKFSSDTVYEWKVYNPGIKDVP